MLQVFLCPKNQPHFIPDASRLQAWFSALVHSGMISCEDQSQALQALTTAQASFTPGIGVIGLFNQEAIDSLLPAELTFESLSICQAPQPELIPLELDDRAAFCPHCEDQFPEREIVATLSQLNFLSLDQCAAFCESCQSEHMLRRVVFEPPSQFARFWLLLDQVGSTRLNPSALREWSALLGCPLQLLVAQNEASWEEFTQNDQTEPYFFSESLERAHYRAQRFERKQRGKRRKR